MDSLDECADTGIRVIDCERRFRRMAENIDFGMFRITAGNRILISWSNSALACMLGYGSPQELCIIPARDHFINPAEFDELASHLVLEGVVTRRDICLKRRDGSALWVSIRAWGAGTAEDECRLIDGFAEDITERLAFEQEMHYHESELNRYAHALTMANRKLNLLSSITRHDLLNKLTGLQGYLDLIREDFRDPLLDDYLNGQEEILGIISQQIRFTKDYQELGIHAPRWFGLEPLIRTAAAGIIPENVTFELDCGNIWIYADPMVGKVFYNLIENAVNYGKNLNRISFSAEVREDCAMIVCEDDGGGIPEQFKKAIFVREHFTHTGFGLFLSREILGITGMTILECGKPGAGARFEITVPAGYFRQEESAPGPV